MTGLRCYSVRVRTVDAACRLASLLCLLAASLAWLAAARLSLTRLRAAGLTVRFRAAAALIDRTAARLPDDATDIDIRPASWLGIDIDLTNPKDRRS